MSTKAATREFLAGLHEQYANYLKGLLDEAGKVDDDGNPVGMPLDAATLGNIRGFLKDNEVTADPAAADTLDELREKFSKAANKKGTVKKSPASVVAAAEEAVFTTPGTLQ